MVAVPPMSAFEVYQQMKSSKKKSSKRKKNKNTDVVKITPQVSAELLKIAKESGSQVTKNKSPASSEQYESSSTSNVQQNLSAASKVKGHQEWTNSKDEKLVTLVEAPTGSKKTSEVTGKEAGEQPKMSKKAKKNKKKENSLQVNQECLKTTVKTSPKASKSAEISSQISLSTEAGSMETAESFFSWLIYPMTKEEFFKLYWEKRPMHISRENTRDYYADILSTSAIDEMFRKHNILFGKNVDITAYRNNERITRTPGGRAHAGVVWDYYRNGCSVRLLNPQTYHARLRELNTGLQEVFNSFVGANAYLTPPNSQGFAPHYDDIEAFVLQTEGSKLWRIYAPRDKSELLPRTSSPNFSQEEIGEPIMEVLLKAGDLLYFPRGFIHQANTVPGEHSLHVTVSTYQRNSWADFFEKLVPAALANAIEENEEFRRGLPLDAFNHLGAVYSDVESPERDALLRKVKKLFSKLLEYAPVDAAADQMVKEYIHEALPPYLTPVEKKCSVLENSDRMVSNGILKGATTPDLQTRIRLTRSNVLRLVSEEEPDTMKIYHSMENSLEYHGEALQCIEIPLEQAPAVEHLIHSYPAFTSVSDLPLDDDLDKIQIAAELWERGLVLTEEPLQVAADFN